MKSIKFLIIYFIFLGCLISMFFIKPKNNNNLKKITVAEVAHTIFYAPQYVAINNGYFEDEGLEIELILTPGADKVASSLLSNDVDIGLAGSEICIYVYNNGEKDYLKTISQLTQKDGSFLVSRNKISKFKLDNLKGKYIIGGRKAGMPEMTLEYALKNNGIDPKNDVYIDTSISFAAMEGAFISGIGDYVSLFEPNASNVEKNGYGYVVASIGELGGNVPYTSYIVRNSFIKDNKNLIIKFNKAIKKGLDYVHNNSDIDVAKNISSFFPDTSLNDLAKAINRYRSIDAWPNDINFSKESFYHLQDIMKSNGELKKEIKYEELIYNE